MNPAGRRRIVPAALIAFASLASACTAPSGSAALASPERLAPMPGETYLSLGKRLLAAREPELATKAFFASITEEGASAQAFTGAGIAAYQQGLLTSARRYFEEARRLAPDSPITHSNLGVVLSRLKEYYAARDEFRTAFALSSGASEIAERNLNRVEAAIALIEENPKADPAISHDVVRLGSSEFQLVESTPSEADISPE